eukprot:3730599-Prymnesium_polylepis.1
MTTSRCKAQAGDPQNGAVRGGAAGAVVRTEGLPWRGRRGVALVRRKACCGGACRAQVGACLTSTSSHSDSAHARQPVAE